MFEKKTMIDFLAKENLKTYQMEYTLVEDNIFRGGHRRTTLRQHKLEVKDSLFDPFDSTSRKLDYIQIGDTNHENSGENYEHYFVIDNNIQVVKRVRYNFWMALGDIGGFYDGLKLLITFFMAPISAILFENDLLKDNLFVRDLTRE